MKLLRGDNHGGAEVIFLQNFLGEADVFKGIGGLVLHKNAAFVHPLPQQVNPHGLRLGNILAGPLTAGDDAGGFRIGVQVANGGVQALREHQAGRFPINGGAQDDDGGIFRRGASRAPQHHNGNHDEPDQQDGGQRHQNDENNPQPLSLPDILEYAPEKGRPDADGQAQGAGGGGSDDADIDDAARQRQQRDGEQQGEKNAQQDPRQPAPFPAGAAGMMLFQLLSSHRGGLLFLRQRGSARTTAPVTEGIIPQGGVERRPP